MKNSLIFLFGFLFLTCINNNSNSKEASVLVEENSPEAVEKSEVFPSIQDCIFDQSTQTDDFLKGINEFQGYLWDNESKSAEVVLNDHWSLTITRGGCEYFELSVRFFYDRKLDIEKDKKQMFDQIIWTTLLIDDFEGEIIKEAIENNQFTITKNDEHNYHINFMDQRIYELYNMTFSNENNRTTFEIGSWIT